MEVDDDALDGRLRMLATPSSEAVERIAARALSVSARKRSVRLPLTAASACVAVLLAVILFSSWPRSTPTPPTAAPQDIGVVLMRAPDGSSVIVSTGAPTDQLPPGTGYLISEGGQR